MEEVVNGIGPITPLFSGPLPFGRYQNDRIGILHIKTRSKRQFDGLFVDDIWPGSILLADYLIKYEKYLCNQKNILEIGSGSALPSLVASRLSPNHVVITDYPEETIIQNIEESIEENHLDSSFITVLGYKWGDDVTELLQTLSGNLFDIIILSEVLWKDTYSEHR